MWTTETAVAAIAALFILVGLILGTAGPLLRIYFREKRKHMRRMLEAGREPKQQEGEQ